MPDPQRTAEILKSPRRSLNLSIAEGDRLAQLDQRRPNSSAARALYLPDPGARLRTYAARGVAGIEPYVREGGR